MFHYFNVPYITCNFFTKFTYNEYIGPYFLSHVVSKIFASAPPPRISRVTKIDDADTTLAKIKFVLDEIEDVAEARPKLRTPTFLLIYTKPREK